MFGPPARWPGPIAWTYNPAGATAAFSSTSDAVAAIAAGAAKWAAVCGVQFSYLGTTTVAPDTEVDGKPDLQNVIGWAHLGSGILGNTSAFYNRAGGAPYALVDTDIALSIDLVGSGATMDRVATHEWGHMLGLGHSNLDGQVMSGTPDSQYNSLTDLQPDDIRGCRCLYGMPGRRKAGLHLFAAAERRFWNGRRGNDVRFADDRGQQRWQRAPFARQLFDHGSGVLAAAGV